MQSPTMPLPCPFCGSPATGRTDGPEPRPFVIRCSGTQCPGANAVGYADPEAALTARNRRVQLSPQSPRPVCDVYGFTKRNLIRGELVTFTLDRTGVLTSDAIDFGA